MAGVWQEIKSAAEWMGTRFASWFTTAWLYIILWGVVAGAFVVLLYIDGVFSRKLAPDSINPLSFQAMGWVYRFFAAAFLMAAARCVYKGIKGKWTFRLLGVFASLIVCLHAWGFGFEALDERRDQALAAQTVASVQTDTNAEIIATLEAQKAQIDADTTAAVAALDAEIRQYITDGRDNDDLADDSRARRTQLQDAAIARKQELDERIIDLKLSNVAPQEQAAETEITAEPWAPIFVGMAQLFTWTKEPTDWAIYICAIMFVVFWVLLGESLVIFLPERIYVMHLADAEAAKRSAAARKGHETRKSKDGFTTPPMVEDKGYWESRIEKALATKLKRPTAEGIADSYFGGMSIHELRNHLQLRMKKGLLDQRDFEFLTDPEGFAERQQQVNGLDKGTDGDENDTGTYPVSPAT